MTFEEKLISNLQEGLKTFGKHAACDRGVHEIMKIPHVNEFILLGEERLIALIEKLHADVDCGNQLIEAIGNQFHSQLSMKSSDWDLYDSIAKKLDDGSRKWFAS